MPLGNRIRQLQLLRSERREAIYASDSEESAASFDSLDALETAQSQHHASASVTQKLKTVFSGRVYSTLPSGGDSIRLLTLRPGEGASKIECSLAAVLLSEAPDYVALSYTWGDPKSPRRSVLLDGKSFSVRENLWWALLYLRHPAKPRQLWIDAICINQDDAHERNAQVPLMGRIYSQAVGVEIWLGRATVGSKLSMRFLSYVSSSSDRSDEEILVALNDMPGVEVKLRRLLHLRLYWNRLWILQEAILAKNVTILCGGDRIPWDAFRTAIHRLRVALPYLRSAGPQVRGGPKNSAYLGLHSALDGTFSITLDSIRSTRMSSPSRDIDLRTVLGISYWSSCSVRRDKLYGLLGLFENSMPVDYQKSMFAVYTDAVKHIQHPSIRGPPELYHLYTVRFSRLLQRLLKGPFTNPHTSVSCFTVRGLFGGVIVGLDDSFGRAQTGSTGWKLHGNPKEPVTVSAESLIAQISEEIDHSQRALLQMAAENLPSYSSWGGNLSSKPCIPHYFAVTPGQEEESIPQVPTDVGRSGEVPVAASSSDNVSRSSLFLSVSPKPLFGYAPPTARAGDLLVRFLVSNTSIIIRKSGDNYEFIGRAFVPHIDNSASNLAADTREIDHDPVEGDPVELNSLEVYKHSCDITLDAETLQFVSSYDQFETPS